MSALHPPELEPPICSNLGTNSGQALARPFRVGRDFFHATAASHWLNNRMLRHSKPPMHADYYGYFLQHTPRKNTVVPVVDGILAHGGRREGRW